MDHPIDDLAADSFLGLLTSLQRKSESNVAARFKVIKPKFQYEEALIEQEDIAMSLHQNDSQYDMLQTRFQNQAMVKKYIIRPIEEGYHVNQVLGAEPLILDGSHLTNSRIKKQKGVASYDRLQKGKTQKGGRSDITHESPAVQKAFMQSLGRTYLSPIDNAQTFRYEPLNEDRILDAPHCLNKVAKVLQQDDELLQTTTMDQEFPLFGYNTNKTLKNYDCFKEETTPEDWLSKFVGTPGPHGEVPVYRNGEYHWWPVILLDYDPVTQRFKVQEMETLHQKEVHRLSIKFHDGTELAFKERLILAKERQKRAEEEQRFQKYVNAVPDRKVSHEPIELHNAIMQMSGINSSTQGLDRQQREFRSNLVSEAANVYSTFMKKVYVLDEMAEQSNESKWQKLRIVSRIKPPTLPPLLGTLKIPTIFFDQVHETISKLHLTHQQEVIDVVKKGVARIVSFETFELFKANFPQGSLPMSIEDYVEAQTEHHTNAVLYVSHQVRDYFINEIQDALRAIYKFYNTDVSAYYGSQLQRLLTMIDQLFQTYVRFSFVQGSVKQYTQFLRSFLLPKEDLNESWPYGGQPLIFLDVNIMFQTKKEKKKKADKDKGQLGEEQTVADLADQLEDTQTEIVGQESGQGKTIPHEETMDKFNAESDLQDSLAKGTWNDEMPLTSLLPSQETVVDSFLSFIHELIDSTNEIKRLEKDLVPLMNLERQPSYPVSSENPEIQQQVDEIKEIVQRSFTQANQIIEKFKVFQFIQEKTASQVVKSLFGDSKTPIHILTLDIPAINEKLVLYSQAIIDIPEAEIDNKHVEIFEIRTTRAKNALLAKATEILQALLAKISEICSSGIQRTQKVFEEMGQQLGDYPKTEKALIDLKSLIATSDSRLTQLGAETQIINTLLDILENYRYTYNDELVQNFWLLKLQPSLIKGAVLQAKTITTSLEDKFLLTLQNEKIRFAQDIQKLFIDFDVVKKQHDIENVKQNADQAIGLMDSIVKTQETIQSFNEREALFKQPLTDYDEVQKLKTEFTPYHDLWEAFMLLQMDITDWNTSPLLKLEYSAVEKKLLQEYYKKAKGLLVFFEEQSDRIAIRVVEAVLDTIARYRQVLWLIECLTTEAMRNPKRSLPYWNELFAKTGIKELDLVNELTLQALLDAQIIVQREAVEEVSRKAEKQYGLEKKFKEIEDVMKDQKFDILEYKQTNSYVLKGVDDIQQILDNQLNIIMMMKASPYIKPIQKAVVGLETRIVTIQDTLEEWTKCQRGWIYLEPILASEDIQTKLPLEKKKFDSIDFFWRTTMDKFNVERSIWEGIDSDRLKQELIINNRNLDAIQKSLSGYLETKRTAFPRFYFLSDEELLEILADTKDPQKVQRHIMKCFEAINQLIFENESVVTGMTSSEKEKVNFSKAIDVNEGDRKGNVERWLLDIEHLMVETLRKITEDAIIDTTTRTEWVRRWPGQIVLCANMIRWTGLVETAFKSEGNVSENFKQCYSVLEQQLRNVVDLVRQNLGEIERLTLGALVTLDVHAKDVVAGLIENSTTDIGDFEWTSQLRYYWEQAKVPIQWVRMVNASLKYGFEYLGNSPRLVITPLTDRCYRTLMGAFQLSYGGAPEGPAGTGKTETVKDLAKACAMQCIVFNCSDGLNYLAMRKFFKGIVSSGAWCCFDEFNRIELEVLSVIAQQVLTIQNAVKENRKTFWFDDTDITLNKSCCINITMNPGYAGRSELPDNLKALFRPCAMMVPDYALIAEIFLYSVGFQDARNLARKIVSSLKLSSEQLSSQSHYDFGMRALKAILTAAGQLKAVSDETEDILCLRALMNVNLPKFTQNDIPLFINITGDLFPGVEIPDIDQGILLQALFASTKEKMLIPKPTFVHKCLQLYDTIMVRHGLMIVGAAFSGKSTVINILKSAMTSLQNEEGFVGVSTSIINPKSVTGDQLYGKLDPETKTWTDGIISIIIRRCSSEADNPERKWVIFDGPVDAVWIENMNTVLDDNKKLCLTSGEIIKLTPQMTMIFEVEDLAQASPATVSRCGMVFLESAQLGWLPLLGRFVQTLSEIWQPYVDLIEKTTQKMIDYSISWAVRKGVFPVHNSQMTIVTTCLRLIQAQLTPFEKQTNVKLPKEMTDILAQIIVFAVLWSIGAALEENSRKKYQIFISRVISGDISLAEEEGITQDLEEEYELLPIPSKIPEKASLFDLCYDSQRNTWPHWNQLIERAQIDKSILFHEIFVPTTESIRNDYMVRLSVENRFHLLLCGPTGTGKTLNVISQLNKHYYNAEYTNLCTAFSGKTQANQVQLQIESRVSSRRRKGVFGPEEGKKCIVIFIDDLNMPIKEVYGAQPPIELLRFWMDTGGWYDLETKEWKNLMDIVFIAAMMPPTGGRSSVTLRYLRHFNLLYVEPFGQNSLNTIFSSIMDWYFNIQTTTPSKEITSLSSAIVASSLELYEQIQTEKSLLPTPAKSHYIYNLRDIGKIFQGIAKSSYRSYRTGNEFISLWSHECLRVFSDRLISHDDRQTLKQLLSGIIRSKLKRNWEDIITSEPLLWGSFVPTIKEGDNQKPSSGIYCQLSNPVSLKQKCQDMLNSFNEMYTAEKMNLVLFDDALQHIVRLSRVITTTLGNCLLVGVGGSGRKSLSTLATFIAYETELRFIDQKDWTSELQKLLKIAGLDGKDIVVHFSDSQIIQEQQLEDISNILNKGEVPNLFPAEERAKIIEEIGSSIPGTMNQKLQGFVSECRRNLHLILSFSPVSEEFRVRLRNFPALVACTTINWFLPWPEEALRSTAFTHFRETMQITEQQQLDGLVDVAVDMQTRIERLSRRYYDELRHHYYVTPTSFLELLNQVAVLKSERDKNIALSIERYSTGTQKIVQTEAVVVVMQKELEELQPLLIKKTEENSLLLINVQRKQKEVDSERETCEAEERQCDKQRDQAAVLRADCQKDLDKVLPLLAGAAQALELIQKDHMTQLRSFANPPPSAAVVMEGICYAFNEDQSVQFVPVAPGSIERRQDFWGYAKRHLLNDKLIVRVKAFKEDQIKAIPPKKVEKLKAFLYNPLFEEEKVKNASFAAYNLSLWIRAVVATYDALLVVEPKRKLLESAEESLKIVEAELAMKKAALQKVLAVLDKLQIEYRTAKQEKEDLQEKVNQCQLKLSRADKLLGGLGGEKKAWTEKSIGFQGEVPNILGDSMICSGIIAYLGAFPLAYRQETTDAWITLLKKLGFACSDNFSLANILCDPITIGKWTNSFKLPDDSFSIDNGIILKNSSRWPLMIDPQGQANTWVKNMENASREIQILRPTDSITEQTLKLENSISLGLCVLLENMGEQIHQIYEPLLQKKLVRVGSAYKLKFGDKLIDYSPDFKFYMTTKLPRPHYSPEICIKVTVLNFEVTAEGLEDQMLNIVVALEEPAKEAQRIKNVEEFFYNKDKQRKTEDLILKLLYESQGEILEDETLIDTLQRSKIESREVEEKLKKLDHDRETLQQIRNFYKSVAKSVAAYYFVILDLALVEATYMWSLEFYITLFVKSIDRAIPGKENRCENIITKFQEFLYDNVCRSLLEKDKIVFTLLLCLKHLETQGKISKEEVRFLMLGGTWTEVATQQPNNTSSWLEEKKWISIQEVTQTLPAFKNFTDDFISNLESWQTILESTESILCEIPGQSKTNLTKFQKLIPIRILKPALFVLGIQDLIASELGPHFISPPPFNLEASYRESDPFVPLIFILSSGADPRLELLDLADKFSNRATFSQLSLGQGQGEIAERCIKEGFVDGRWILLQNCHLAPSFMPDLERIIETIPQDVHRDFRIWLTSMPDGVFPHSVLMKGIKLTFQPPRGLKNSLMRAFTSHDKQQFENVQKSDEWRKLFFGLSFFHSFILERREYGPLGWNIPYEFTAADFVISMKQLRTYLEESSTIPWKALNYMTGEANYGGRVTDPKDRLLLSVVLGDIYSEKILNDEYRFSSSGIYYAPPKGDYDSYVKFIADLPLNNTCEVFGLHQNAEITKAIIDANNICSTILSVLPREGSAGGSQESITKEKIRSMLEKLPPPFDLEASGYKYPMIRSESLNTVLRQELIRFQKLLSVVRTSLTDLEMALDGLLIMNADLEALNKGVLDNYVPAQWHQVTQFD